MSHDIQAHWATTALAAYLLGKPADCFAKPPPAGALSAFATREGRAKWPHCDGVVELKDASHKPEIAYPVAIEFKRLNEGLHGTLTAFGQAHAYVHKGFAGSAIVIPKDYPTLAGAGDYLRDVLKLVSQAKNVGVFVYEQPDPMKASPFDGKIKTAHAFCVDAPRIPGVPAVDVTGTETQWAHVREGSTDPDAFFKYLQCLKLVSTKLIPVINPALPPELVDAVRRIDAKAHPLQYLSNAPAAGLSDDAWRDFWFRYVVTAQVLTPWRKAAGGKYEVNEAYSNVLRADGKGNKMFFAGRSDSIKNKLVDALNAKEKTEAEAWKDFAKNVHDRAHSYREDIDSGCEHLGFVNEQGLLTESGFRFVDACERYGNPNEGVPRQIFAEALLVEGALGALLHYVWRLSDEAFDKDPFAFTEKAAAGALRFNREKYLEWLEGEMANRLKVLRKAAARGGASRLPFQAELAMLRLLGVVDGFRIGQGLTINWPEYQRIIGM